MSLSPNFDRLAKPYRWMERLSFGPMLHRSRTAFLPQLQSARNTLVLGDGDGRFTHDLLQQSCRAHVHAVDLSGAMLQELSKRCQAFEHRLQTTQINALEFTPTRSYNLVTTHFFLDCLSQHEVERLVRKLSPALSQGATWVVSEFSIPEGGPVRPFATLLIRSLYVAFRLLTGLRINSIPQYAPSLQRAGFVCIERKEFLAGILVSELWQRINITQG